MPEETGRQFFRRTRLSESGPLEPSDQVEGVPPPAAQLPIDDGARIIDLPRPENITVPRLDLTVAIQQRASIRRYSRKALSLKEVSHLLWCTQGVKTVASGQVTLRTVPSAGARHALETYLLVNNVSDLKEGLYRFLPVEHKLTPIPTTEDVRERMVKACLGQDFVAAAAVVFIWTACAYRMTWRYGQRGYRYLLLDAGHVCQNLYLAGEAIGSGVCAIGAFDDEGVNTILGLDGEDRFAIYLAAVGKKP